MSLDQLKKYIGGQVEILSDDSPHKRYRGQISFIEIRGENHSENPVLNDQTLHVEFSYICGWTDLGYKPIENKPYDLSLCICSWNDIGMDRFCISSRIINEIAVFYPKTHNKRVLEDGTMESNDA